MLEEQLREMELRSLEQLVEEQRKSRDLLVTYILVATLYVGIHEQSLCMDWLLIKFIWFPVALFHCFVERFIRLQSVVQYSTADWPTCITTFRCGRLQLCLILWTLSCLTECHLFYSIFVSHCNSMYLHWQLAALCSCQDSFGEREVCWNWIAYAKVFWYCLM